MLQFYFTCLLTNRLTKSMLSAHRTCLPECPENFRTFRPRKSFKTLHFNVKNRYFEFSVVKRACSCYFRSGEIIHAEYAETGGMDALEKIVQNRVGKFNFSPKLPDDAAKMKPLGNFMGILMNCLKDMDEKMSEDDNDEV